MLSALRRTIARDKKQRRRDDDKDAPWDTLQDDLVVHVGRCCDAKALVALGASCKNWRAVLAAVEGELWRALLLRDFPRMQSILELTHAGPTVPLLAFMYYRLYREQYAVDMPIVQTRKTSLSDYIFTVELLLGPRKDVKDVGSETMRWTGTFSQVVRDEPADHNSDCHAVCADDSYPHFDASTEELEEIEQLLYEEAISAKLTVYVTHQLKTIKLCEEAFDMYSENEAGFSFEWHDLPKRYGAAELAGDNLVELVASVMCRSVPSYPWQPERDVSWRPGDIELAFHSTDMVQLNTEQVVGYLEDVVPWP